MSFRNNSRFWRMKKKSRLGSNIIAAVWGIAEASFFFIVPDVFLSYIALQSYKKALIASVYALVGAICGGLIIYWWAYHNESGTIVFLDLIPGISPELIAQGKVLFQQDMFYGMLQGSVTGIPYKIFSAQAGIERVSIISFILASIPARFIRFAIVPLATSYISRTLLKSKSYLAKTRILCGFWIVFYIGYFYKVGW